MEPAVRPGQPQPVPLVGLGVGESLRGACRTADGSSGPRGPFAFTIVYRGDAATSCDTVSPSRGKEMQDQGHPQRRIAPDVQRGQHDAAIAFAADHRALVPNGTSHVGLAHRRADQAGARGPGRILHDQAGREIHDHRRRSRAVTAASIQHSPDRERQRVVLADRPCRVSSTSASRSTSGSTARPMSAPLSPHQRAELAQVLGHRLRRAGESGRRARG